MNHSELIAMLREIENSWSQSDDVCKTAKEAADALQAMEFALDATATPKSLTTKREKVILLTGAQNENSLLRAQLATQSLRLEDANGLLRYVADQRDAALGKLQALERVPWQPIETAPKDGTDIIVMYMHIETQIVHNAFWIDTDRPDICPDGWWSYTDSESSRLLLDDWRAPTHWMPLPTPPESKG